MLSVFVLFQGVASANLRCKQDDSGNKTVAPRWAKNIQRCRQAECFNSPCKPTNASKANHHRTTQPRTEILCIQSFAAIIFSRPMRRHHYSNNHSHQQIQTCQHHHLCLHNDLLSVRVGNAAAEFQTLGAIKANCHRIGLASTTRTGGAQCAASECLALSFSISTQARNDIHSSSASPSLSCHPLKSITRLDRLASNQ